VIRPATISNRITYLTQEKLQTQIQIIKVLILNVTTLHLLKSTFNFVN